MAIIKANYVNIEQRRTYPAEIRMEGGRIVSITEINEIQSQYILPGFIDAHVHIESSMLIPTFFAQKAVTHGTVASISDPHEIANVLGLKGVEFMLNNAKKSPMYFFFGAPSCVPATSFENSGAKLGLDEMEILLDDERILYLAEMMNFPAVIDRAPIVMNKINAALKKNKKVDGHAPGLRGAAAEKYFSAGITTDHECFSYEEGKEKAGLGVHILIREGSAAKNFDALIPLLAEFPNQIMFCSDDKHPDDLIKGHINELVKRALKEGYDLYDILKAACINPVKHYNLPVGILRAGDSADFILVDNLKDFTILSTYIQGEKIYGQGLTPNHQTEEIAINQFSCSPITTDRIEAKPNGNKLRVIQAIDGALITKEKVFDLNNEQYPSNLESILAQDILKIVVINRYQDAPPAIAYITGFGFKKGAIASTVAHDSHNIIAVGCNDKAIVESINQLISVKGGVSATDGGNTLLLPLPVGGLMSLLDCDSVGTKYQELDQFSKQILGSTLSAPFMTLSFMALLVIPELKLSDLGLFDGKRFEFTPASF